MKKIKIVENGHENNPGILTGKIEWGKAEFRSSLFRDGCYLKLSKAQARKLAKFLVDFAGSKTREVK